MTTPPNTTSNHFMLFLVAIGSRKLVQIEHVAIPASVTETVDTLAAAKNKIQWAAIKKPVPKIFKVSV